MTPTMQNHVRPSMVMWIPLVLVGSVLYWSLALGLGGLSLSFFGDASGEDLALRPPATVVEEPIVVRLQSMSELRGTGGNTSQDDGTGRLPGSDSESPVPPHEDPIGRTAY